MSARHHRFEALVGALLPDLYRYAYWLCRDRPRAEDAVQETLVRAWRSLDTLRDERAAKPWLITILRRELARSYERVQPELVDIDDAAYGGTLVGDPGDMGEQASDAAAVRRALARLEPEYREPLVMQVLLGYSIEEIATVMEMNPATVLTRLFRARKKLAAVLEQPGALLGAEGA
jgi:RNA polymerase sigma-70 factor (ECF subfamily)